jgi:tripartite-type tricarboxylate transporter receptor subunit TctC
MHMLGISERTTAMKFPHRRQFLQLAAGAAALPAVSRIAWAQAYPTRPVRIIVGYAAGGVTDIVARLFGQWLSERLAQPFVVENRPGAGGTVADQAAVSAPHDGYTLVMGGLAQAINVTLYDKPSLIRDLAPVAGLIRTPLVMEVNPAFPAKTVPEFIAYAKANPGKINVASGGNGSPSHMFGELFKMMTGLNMVHVPYRGTALALTDLLGGQVQVVFDAVPSSVGYIRASRVRALAVTTAMRSDALPEIPIMGDFVTGYEASAWLGLSAPKNTPPEIIEKLNREINAALADPKIKPRLADFGGTALPGSPADFGKLIAEETEKWGKVIRAANIKPE